MFEDGNKFIFGKTLGWGEFLKQKILRLGNLNLDKEGKVGELGEWVEEVGGGEEVCLIVSLILLMHFFMC